MESETTLICMPCLHSLFLVRLVTKPVIAAQSPHHQPACPTHSQTNVDQSSVTNEGALLEYETLQLRVTPPNVVIDNESYDDRTLVTVDSANRPGLWGIFSSSNLQA